MAPTGALLDLPEELQIVALVRLGYPQDIPTRRPRRPVEEPMQHEKPDRAKPRNVRLFIETSYGKGWGRL